MSGNPTWVSELEDRVETDVAGRECCTRNAGNEASTKSGNEKVKCPKKRRKGPKTRRVYRSIRRAARLNTRVGELIVGDRMLRAEALSSAEKDAQAAPKYL